MKTVEKSSLRLKTWLQDVILGKHMALAWYPNVYLPKDEYDELMFDEEPRIEYQALLVHEAVHLERQAAVGVWFWFLKYIVFPSFRYQEELIAITEQWQALAALGGDAPVIEVAYLLSGKQYGYQVPFARALNDLNRIWNDIHVDLE